MKELLGHLRRDGWLLALIGLCVVLCLMLSARNENISATGTTALETRLAQVLSAMDGAGQVEVAVFYQDEQETVPCGAVVVADGAGDMAVQLRLTRAVMTLLNVDADKISIFQRKGE